MPFSGDDWDESSPDNNDLANEIDDYMRDDKSAVRGRMAHEHNWPTSQSATNQGGFHKYITFTTQTSAPALVYGTSTQIGALYVGTNKHLTFEDSAGGTYTVALSGAGVAFFGGTGAIGSLPYVTSGGGFSALTASAAGTLVVSNGATTAPSYKAMASIVVVTSGQASHAATVPLPSGVNSNEVQAVMVSIGNMSSKAGTSAPDGHYEICTVDASRVVTCTWTGISGGGSGTGTANYVLIGIVTH